MKQTVGVGIGRKEQPAFVLFLRPKKLYKSFFPVINIWACSGIENGREALGAGENLSHSPFSYVPSHLLVGMRESSKTWRLTKGPTVSSS